MQQSAGKFKLVNSAQYTVCWKCYFVLFGNLLKYILVVHNTQKPFVKHLILWTYCPCGLKKCFPADWVCIFKCKAKLARYDISFKQDNQIHYLKIFALALVFFVLIGTY